MQRAAAGARPRARSGSTSATGSRTGRSTVAPTLARLGVDPHQLVRLVVAGDERRPRSRPRPRARRSARSGSLIGLPIGLPVRASSRTTWFARDDRHPDRVAGDDRVGRPEADLRARRTGPCRSSRRSMRHAVERNEPTKMLPPAARTTFGRRPTVISVDHLGRGDGGGCRGAGRRGGRGRARGVRRRRVSPSASAATTPTAAASTSAGGDERLAALRRLQRRVVSLRFS